MKKPVKYSPEVRERAVRLVGECRASHPSQWAAIESSAAKIGCSTATLHTWVSRHEVDTGQRPGVTSAEAQRVKGLDFRLQDFVTSCPGAAQRRIALTRSMTPIARRGDLQELADRLDPEGVPVPVDEIVQDLRRRSSSGVSCSVRAPWPS